MTHPVAIAIAIALALMALGSIASAYAALGALRQCRVQTQILRRLEMPNVIPHPSVKVLGR